MMCLSTSFAGHHFSLVLRSADSTRHSPAQCSTREGTHSRSGLRSSPWRRGAGRSRSGRRHSPPDRLRFWQRPGPGSHGPRNPRSAARLPACPPCSEHLPTCLLLVPYLTYGRLQYSTRPVGRRLSMSARFGLTASSCQHFSKSALVHDGSMPGQIAPKRCWSCTLGGEEPGLLASGRNRVRRSSWSGGRGSTAVSWPPPTDLRRRPALWCQACRL